MREKAFETRIKAFLDSVGIYRIGTPKDQMPVKPRGYWVKRWGGGKYVPAGIPDMQITVGVFNVDVELKTATGRIDPLQLQKLRQIREAGGYAMILRPKHFEDFRRFIMGLLLREEQLRGTGEVWECNINEEEIWKGGERDEG